MKTIFATHEYRKILKSFVDSPAQGRGILSRLAEALGCQNSHLSRLMREEVHLTPDQAFEACRFMNLTEPETQYFLKLVEYERAANPRFRARLMDELKAMRREQEDLASRFRDEQVSHSENEMTYYSSWFWSAIHILTDIPAYRTTRAIATRLGLDEMHVRHCLTTLAKFGLVEHSAGGIWTISSNSIHLPKQSPMISVHHANWRARAVSDSQKLGGDSLHYSIVQAIGQDDMARIKQLLLDAIDRYRTIAEASGSEELICLNFDFFKV